MIKEFKKFISRGNVIDLSVGIIIGGAFSAITNSLVNDILMPFIGMVCGGIDFTDLSINIKDSKIAYGSFIQAIINFLIIAFALFMIVKVMNKLFDKKKPEEAKPKKADDIILLEEIRDLLKENKKK